MDLFGVVKVGLEYYIRWMDLKNNLVFKDYDTVMKIKVKMNHDEKTKDNNSIISEILLTIMIIRI